MKINKLKKITTGAALLTGLFVASVQSTFAMCPVCTVAVLGGVELSHYLGIDDVITGLWIGALMVSITMWTSNWLRNKKWRYIPKGAAFWFIIWVLMTYVPLYQYRFFGHNNSQLWGIDKIIIGSMFGVVIFALAVVVHNWLKARNGDKVYVQFQRVIIPVSFLIIGSVAFYFITK
ncbi:MAG: hypothetical protein WC773_00400 [Patescibacteria group bacterium]|jgi:hypothetical protein